MSLLQKGLLNPPKSALRKAFQVFDNKKNSHLEMNEAILNPENQSESQNLCADNRLWQEVYHELLQRSFILADNQGLNELREDSV